MRYSVSSMTDQYINSAPIQVINGRVETDAGLLYIIPPSGSIWLHQVKLRNPTETAESTFHPPVECHSSIQLCYRATLEKNICLSLVCEMLKSLFYFSYHQLVWTCVLGAAMFGGGGGGGLLVT